MPEHRAQKAARQVAEDARQSQQRQADIEARTLADIRSQIERFGVDVVIAVKRQTDPNWQLPAELQSTNSQ